MKIKENIQAPRHWPLTGGFPSQRASNARIVSIWWRHHVCKRPALCFALLWLAIGRFWPYPCHNKTVRNFHGLYYILNTLARIFNYLDLSAHTIMYNTFVASNFNCCLLVWHLCGVSNGNKMREIQERRRRIIYKGYESSHDRLLEMRNTTSLVISRLRILLLEVQPVYGRELMA